MNKEFQLITVNLEKGIYINEGLKKAQVELRQTVITKYPSMRLSNSLQDGLFTNEDAGITSQDFIETRIAFMPVGEITDIDAVTTKLADSPNAVIYRIMSLEPIISDGEAGAIENNLTTLEAIAAKQRVKDKDGKFVNYKNDIPQYRRTAFSLTGKEDIDYRPVQFATMNISENSTVEMLAKSTSIKTTKKVGV